MGHFGLVGPRAALWGGLVAGLGALALLAGPSRALAAAPSAVNARAWLVENPTTGQILDEHAPNAELPIASITKLMTVMIALERLAPDQIVRVDPRAATVGQERIALWAGQQITVRELVEGALIQSANDAADALALAVSPSFPAFATLMNAKARALGLRHTHFVRPDGLDAPGEYSSAADVTRLALDAMRLPLVRATVDRRSATLSDGEQLSTWNDLLGVFPGVFGVKTGNTGAAGWCQVLAAHNDGTTIYVTILGSPSEAGRNADLERLLMYGLAQYHHVTLLTAGRSYATVGLPDGRGHLALVATGALRADLWVDAAPRLRVLGPGRVRLPVRAGQPLGRVEVFAGGRLLGERALVAARAVSAPGLLGRITWNLHRATDALLHAL